MSVINAIEKKYKKPHVVDVKSGDTVKVHQKIREGSKERIQVFEGLVIKTARQGSHTGSITVRRIASGVGVEKTYLIHSPLITKIEVVKRSKVRRNYLSYMRQRTGKSARLSSIDFDQEEVNRVPEPPKEETPAAQPEKEAEADKSEETPDKQSEEETAPKAEDSAKSDKNLEKTSANQPDGKADKKDEPKDGPSK